MAGIDNRRVDIGPLREILEATITVLQRSQMSDNRLESFIGALIRRLPQTGALTQKTFNEIVNATADEIDAELKNVVQFPARSKNIDDHVREIPGAMLAQTLFNELLAQDNEKSR